MYLKLKQITNHLLTGTQMLKKLNNKGVEGNFLKQTNKQTNE